MESNMLPWLLLTLALSMSALAVSVSVLAKRLTQCEADVLDCISAQSRLLELTKKVSSRQAVADFRATASHTGPTSANEIPFGDKAALRAKFLPKASIQAKAGE
jgi:hypothetical protein